MTIDVIPDITGAEWVKFLSGLRKQLSSWPEKVPHPAGEGFGNLAVSYATDERGRTYGIVGWDTSEIRIEIAPGVEAVLQECRVLLQRGG